MWQAIETMVVGQKPQTGGLTGATGQVFIGFFFKTTQPSDKCN